MTLSPLDDYPIHQLPQVMRHTATSDRNFYDRYYFNAFPCSDELMLIFGMGQYPNLGVTDAFAVVRHGSTHQVVRASREIGADRSDTTVGPLRVEVLEGLKRLRMVLEPGDYPLSFDLTWEAAMPAQLEPRHFLREHERVTFDSLRLAQTGGWSGRLTVGSHTYDVSPDQWWGTRDRSWGVRPVGEPEPRGIQDTSPRQFYWMYAPIRFPDFSVLAIVQENAAGERMLEEAVRVWPEGSVERLGRPEYRPEYAPGTREVVAATLSFAPPDGGAVAFAPPRREPVEIAVTPILPVHLMVGTGYGLESGWKHGMYQGPDTVVQHVTYDLERPEDAARMWGMVDAVGRFECDGQVGYGLFEYWALGPHAPSGFTDLAGPARSG